MNKEQEIKELERKLKELAFTYGFEGKIQTDEHEIEVFRSKRDRRDRKARWEWLWGHVLSSLHGLRVDYYLIPESGDIMLCVRGGGHRGYLKVNFDWIFAEIKRLEALGDILFESKRNKAFGGRKREDRQD